jgi:hypothetical protein
MPLQRGIDFAYLLDTHEVGCHGMSGWDPEKNPLDKVVVQIEDYLLPVSDLNSSIRKAIVHSAIIFIFVSDHEQYRCINVLNNLRAMFV